MISHYSRGEDIRSHKGESEQSDRKATYTIDRKDRVQMTPALGTKILVTGAPGVGKTTLVRRVVERVGDLEPVGFYTEEIRERGERVGFRIVDLEGREAILAHVNLHTPYRVGRYRVDVEGFERFLENIPWEKSRAPVVIDEIGKMECLSSRFRALVDRLFASDRVVIATIALRGDAYIEGIKKRSGVMLHVIAKENREGLVGQVEREVRGAMGG